MRFFGDTQYVLNSLSFYSAMHIKLDLIMVVIIKVDQDGFFISWKSEGREAEVLDLSQVITS